MTLIPYKKQNRWLDPFIEMENIQNQMNQLFDFSLSRNVFGGDSLLYDYWSPVVDVYDSKDNIMIKADLPGLTKDEIEISIEDNNIVLRGERKTDVSSKDDQYCKTERFYGSFHKMIPLPAAVEVEKIDAKYRDGVLTLILPKKEESKPRQITVDVK